MGEIVLSPVCACGDRLPGIVVTIVAPTGWLTANDRDHRHAVAARVREWRLTGRTIARAAKLPTFDRARVVAYLRFRDGRRRDPANWAPTIKALVDGMVDAGVWFDDDHKHVVGPDMRIGEQLPARRGGPVGEVVLHITPLGATTKGSS